MKTLLIDIETAPHKALIWGPKNSYIQPKNVVEDGYTMCFAAKWLGERGVTFQSAHRDGAKQMTAVAWQMLSDADAVIHYNGTKFDIPTLNADFVEHGMHPPSTYHELDLLKTVRKKFRRYSNKLDEVARWLGVGAKVQHKGLELWMECMGGDEKAWRVMERYNRMDVHLLERLYYKLRPWIVGHPTMGLYHDRDACPVCGKNALQKRGTAITKTQQYQRYQCQECGSWARDRLNSTPVDKKSVKVAL